MSGTEPGLTREDFEKLSDFRFSYPDPDVIADDPADALPDLSGKKITREKVGRMIVEYAEEHTNREAAEAFGISPAVVDWHRYHDPSYADHATIDADLCEIMRRMAADGFLYSEIMSFANCSRSTVMNHVSSTGGSGCQHDGVVDEPRVSSPPGEEVAKKVDHEMCKELRRRVANGESCRSLAEEFGIGHRTVNRHVSSSIRDSWKCSHNTEPRVDLVGRRRG